MNTDCIMNSVDSSIKIEKNHFTFSGRIADKSCLAGAILGDIIGSSHELKGTRIKTTDFDLFPQTACFTDDTVMTIAVTKWLLERNEVPRDSEGLVSVMQEYGVKYMEVGYGHSFKEWLKSENPSPYNSLGNGSAMRVAAAGLVGNCLKECQMVARLTAEVSHNHPEGIKGAEAVASAIRMAKSHLDKDTIKVYIESKYGYDLTRTVDEIRRDYEFDPTCPGSVPEAIICFLESNDVESAIRNAVSLGGDADTQACIAGAIAGAYYGNIPKSFMIKMNKLLPVDFREICDHFVEMNNPKLTTKSN